MRTFPIIFILFPQCSIKAFFPGEAKPRKSTVKNDRSSGDLAPVGICILYQSVSFCRDYFGTSHVVVILIYCNALFWRLCFDQQMFDFPGFWLVFHQCVCEYLVTCCDTLSAYGSHEKSRRAGAGVGGCCQGSGAAAISQLG